MNQSMSTYWPNAIISKVNLLGFWAPVEVPSKFFYEWLEEHYIEILKVALTKELGPSASGQHTVYNKITFLWSLGSTASAA